MRRIVLAMVVACSILVAFLIPSVPSEAAAGPQCSWYLFQDDAQLAMTQFTYAGALDPDGDGIACNELPPRPPELIGAEAARINRVDDSFELLGASATRNVRVVLAGIDFSQPPGCEMDALGALDSMFPQGTDVFIVPAVPIEELGSGENVRITGWVYGIEPDRRTPFLVNQRLMEAGLGKAATSGLDSPFVTTIVVAQSLAQQQGVGIWGDCEAPNLEPAPTQTPFGQILDIKGSGDQLSSLFSVSIDGTYRLSLNGSASLTFVDLYDQYGNWIPGFSINASDGGSFSSGGYLAAGQYYVQVKSTGAWWITLEPIA